MSEEMAESNASSPRNWRFNLALGWECVPSYFPGDRLNRNCCICSMLGQTRVGPHQTTYPLAEAARNLRRCAAFFCFFLSRLLSACGLI